MSTKRLLMSCSNYFEIPSDAVHGNASEWVINANKNTSTYCIIEAYKGSSTTVTIPDCIDNRMVYTNQNLLYNYSNNATGNKITSISISPYVTGYTNNTKGNMRYLFNYATNLKYINSSIPNGTKDISYLCYNCTNLIQTPISIPNSVNSTASAFLHASTLNTFRTIFNGGNTINASNMFYNCPSLTTVSNSINGSIFENTYAMFNNCRVLKNANMTDLTYVKNTKDMFRNCQALTSVVNISSVEVTDCCNMYKNCFSITGTPAVPNNALSVNCYAMFQNCSKLTGTATIPINCTSAYEMYDDCVNITALPDLSKLTKCTVLYSTFYNCMKVKGPIGTIPESVTSMGYAFCNCHNLTGSIPEFPSNVRGLGSAFSRCYNLTGSIPNIPNSVTSLDSTFQRCYNLTGEIPDIPDNVTSISQTFSRCSKLTLNQTRGLTIGRGVKSAIGWSGATSSSNYAGTFYLCSNLKGNMFIYSNQLNNINPLSFSSLSGVNIYIPYKYENGENTITNTQLRSAGVGSATIKNINVNVIWSFSSDIIVRIDDIHGNNSPAVTTLTSGTIYYFVPNTNITYTIYKIGYNPLTKVYNTGDHSKIGTTTTIIIDESELTSADITLTLNISPEEAKDCDIIFTVDNTISATISNTDILKSIKVHKDAIVKFAIDHSEYFYIGNNEVTVSEDTILDITLVKYLETTTTFTYPFTDTYNQLTNLVDDYNFTIDSSYNAIISGPATYNKSSGKSYGYIEIYTPNYITNISVTGYVNCYEDWHGGGVYVGTEKWEPSNYSYGDIGDIVDNETTTNGTWLFGQTGIHSSSTYNAQLDPNQKYYICFAYLKHAFTNNTVADRLVVSKLQYTSRILI